MEQAVVDIRKIQLRINIETAPNDGTPSGPPKCFALQLSCRAWRPAMANIVLEISEATRCAQPSRG